jgi:hypothetical protein
LAQQDLSTEVFLRQLTPGGRLDAMYGHIVGIPLEETALGFAPLAALAFAGLIALRSRVFGFLRSHLRTQGQ